MHKKEFRAWDTHKKEMVKRVIGMTFNTAFGWKITEWNKMNGEHRFGSICSSILMEYIGRKDIDDKKIFEEDILECDYDDMFDPDGYGYPNPKKTYRFIMEGKDFIDLPDIPRLV